MYNVITLTLFSIADVNNKTHNLSDNKGVSNSYLIITVIV